MRKIAKNIKMNNYIHSDLNDHNFDYSQQNILYNDHTLIIQVTSILKYY